MHLFSRAPLAALAAGVAAFVAAPSAAAQEPAPSAEGARGSPPPVMRTAWVMGTRFHLTVEAHTRASAAAAGEAALREVERLDRLLSTWDSASAMSAANRAAPDRPTPADAELVALLAEAERLAARTGRAFEPAVGALIDAWDLRGRGRRPAADELTRALAASGAGAFAVDPLLGTVRRSAAAWIDTGGFGKGAALRAAARVLQEHGVERALLDLGGQLQAVGGGWALDVAHPRRRHEALMPLRVNGVSVATSGASERWVEVDGERLGHVLDPRTGLPVPAWGSVTVVAGDALAADALATALFVLGPEGALRWAEDEDVGVLVVDDRDGRAVPRWNRAMGSWLDGPPDPTDTKG